MAESGLPGFEASTWFGFFAPSATPRDIVAKLNADSVAALNGAVAAGRASAIRVTSRASQVRGQGHCPYRWRLSSSMATITTGRGAALARGEAL